MKKFFKISIITLLVILLLIMVLIAVLQISAVQNAIIQYALNLVNETIPGEISLDGFEGNLLYHLKLKKITVSNQQRKILAIDEIELNYAPLMLLKRALWIHSATIRQPEIFLIRQDSAQWNLQAALAGETDSLITKEPESSREKFKWEIYILNFEITAGRINVNSDSILVFSHPLQLVNFYLNCAGSFVQTEAALDIFDLRFNLLKPAFAVKSLKTKLFYLNDQLQIDHFQLNTGLSQIQINGIMGLIQPFPVDVKGHADPIHLDDLQKFIPDLSFYKQPQIDFSIQRSLNKLKTIVNLQQDQQKIALNGTFWLADSNRPRYRLTGNLYKFNLMDLLPAPKIPTSLNANFSIQGQGKELQSLVLKTTLTVDSSSRIQNYPFEFSEISASLDHGNLDLNGNVAFNTGQINIDSQIYSLFELPRYQVKLRTLSLSLFELLDLGQPDDFLNSELVLEGKGFNPETFNFISSLKLESSSLFGIQFDEVTFQGRQFKSNFELEKGLIRSPVANLALNGTGSLEPTFNLDYQIELLNLEALPDSLLPVLLSVTGLIQGNISGNPDSLVLLGEANFPLTGHGPVEIDSIQINQMAINFKSYIPTTNPDPLLGMEASCEINTNVITISPDFQIDSLNLTGSFDGETVISELNLLHSPEQQIRLVSQIIPDDTIWVGVDTLEIVFGKHFLASQEPAAITFFTNQDSGAPPIRIENFNLKSDTCFIVADGIIDPNGEQHFELNSANFNLEILAPWFPDYPLNGYLDAILTVDGTFQSPIIASNVTLKNSHLEDFLCDSLNLSLIYAQKNASFGVKLIANQFNSRFFAKGIAGVNLAFVTEDTTRLKDLNQLEIQCKNLNLDILSKFIPGVTRTKGQVQLDLFFTNLLTQPRGSGTIVLNDALFELSQIGVTYDKIQVDCKIDSNQLRVNSFYLAASEGYLNGSASLAWDSLAIENFNVKLKTKEFLAINTDTVNARINTDLLMTGTPTEQKLSGEIELLSSEVNLPTIEESEVATESELEFSPDSVFIDSSSLNVATPIFEMPYLEKMQGLVKIKIPRNSWIRNNMLNIELTGDLNLVKETTYFVLFGTAKVNRGTVEVYGHKFNIDMGLIQFRGQPMPDPSLYIIASYEVRQVKTDPVTIQVIVGGTAESPRITLQSEPYMEQKDIIAYLVFGKPFDFLSSSEQTEMGNSYSDQMGEILAGIAAKQLGQVIAKELNLDIMEFEISPESHEAGFRVGKYLNDEIFVLYSRDGQTSENQSLIIEYQLNKHFSIRASKTRKGDKEDQGIDFFYTREW